MAWGWNRHSTAQPLVSRPLSLPPVVPLLHTHVAGCYACYAGVALIFSVSDVFHAHADFVHVIAPCAAYSTHVLVSIVCPLGFGGFKVLGVTACTLLLASYFLGFLLPRR